jgi:hypothetical protein
MQSPHGDGLSPKVPVGGLFNRSEKGVGVEMEDRAISFQFSAFGFQVSVFGFWLSAFSFLHAAHDRVHDALDDEFAQGHELGTVGVLRYQVGPPLVYDQAFDGRFTVDERHDDSARLRFGREFADDDVPVVYLRADHGASPHAQGEAMWLCPKHGGRVERPASIVHVSRCRHKLMIAACILRQKSRLSVFDFRLSVFVVLHIIP